MYMPSTMMNPENQENAPKSPDLLKNEAMLEPRACPSPRVPLLQKLHAHSYSNLSLLITNLWSVSCCRCRLKTSPGCFQGHL